MQRIIPFLWFDGQAEEAANYYVAIFENSKILSVNRLEGATKGPSPTVTTVAFELDGQEFVALNGGPKFKFTEAISMVVNCETQQEVEYYWGKLTEGGKEVQCGWLKDKFGLSWQVVPKVLPELLMAPDAEKVQRVFEALLQMKKLEIAGLERAFAG